jgi:hypothetical protein
MIHVVHQNYCIAVVSVHTFRKNLISIAQSDFGELLCENIDVNFLVCYSSDSLNKKTSAILIRGILLT